MGLANPVPPKPSEFTIDGWTQPRTCLPKWGDSQLPEPPHLSFRQWRSFVGPGIVMMGIQIGGGEWLFGPEITARFGGGLLWLATLAVFVQVFYNMEVGRYALFCGEPIFTGFLRTRPGPMFWVTFLAVLSLGIVAPGMAFHAASVIASIYLDRAPMSGDRGLVLALGYVCLILAFLPILFGGKIYNTLQTIMSIKIIGVLGFCLAVGLLLVEPKHWWEVLTGFVSFGSLPSPQAEHGDRLVNVFSFWATNGELPQIGLAEIAVIAAFVGYAGGGGLGNSLYSNYVRDRGWGMGRQVGAIPSAIGGRDITLSHLGKVFPIDQDNLRRWNGWWRVVLVDQVFVWAPGCFVGMALPALLSLQFSTYSPLFTDAPSVPEAVAKNSFDGTSEAIKTDHRHRENSSDTIEWANAIITADGMRRAPGYSPMVARVLWTTTLLVGLLVLLPSQMSVVDDVSRRWTDVIWSANKRVRERMKEHQVKSIYYTLFSVYFAWCIVSLYFFGVYGTPRLMILVIANLGNLALGITAVHVLWINCRWLPPAIRPNWYQRLGLAACATFYLGIAFLVFLEKQLPFLRDLLL